LRSYWGAASGFLSSSTVRLRESAMPRWSSSWVVSAMSVTKKSTRPSLLMSPRSEPIDEYGMCGTTRSITLVNVPSRLLR
jgi:hypothetical protein